MLKILLMLSNYFHDLAAALLATNVLVIYFLGRYLDSHNFNKEIMSRVFTGLSRITYGALAYIIIGGAIRAYHFIDFEWNPAIGKGQIPALVVKHILLFTIVIIGIAVQTKYVRKYKNTE